MGISREEPTGKIKCPCCRAGLLVRTIDLRGTVELEYEEEDKEPPPVTPDEAMGRICMEIEKLKWHITDGMGRETQV